MNRRSAFAALLFTLAAPTRLAAQTARVPRIGYLTLAPLGDKASDERLAFLEGLRELRASTARPSRSFTALAR